jgi:hypothetical protein
MIQDIGGRSFKETIDKPKGLKIIKYWDEIFATLSKERQKIDTITSIISKIFFFTICNNRNEIVKNLLSKKKLHLFTFDL